MKKLIILAVPLSVCNLRCDYCYLTARRQFESGHLPDMRFSPQQIAYALRFDRIGGHALINICADGETLLLPNLKDYVAELAAQGHYIEIVSNMTTTKKLNELLALERSVLDRVVFKCSCHYLELKRSNLLKEFANNVNRAYEAGSSITVEVTPEDSLIPYIDELKEYCMREFGALPHVTIARDDSDPDIPRLTSLSLADYNRVWDSFDSSFWDFKTSIFGKRQTAYCQAGSWSYYVNMATGDAAQCYCGRLVGNVFENPDESLPGCAIGSCPLPHCYNGHELLAVGLIPSLDTPSYSEIRDRIRPDGSHWLRPTFRHFLSEKLIDDNEVDGVLVSLFRRLNSKGRAALSALRDRKKL